MIPLSFMRKKITNRFVRSFLDYIPYSVLTAMTFPAILYSTGSVLSAAAGLCVGLVLSYKRKSLLTVALAASCAVFIAEQISVLLV